MTSEVISHIFYGFGPYVPVWKRRQNAEKELARLRQRGVAVDPVAVSGRKIATTFWGEAWCRHFDGMADYSNRLPRGATYVRNGSVCHLAIGRGTIEAMVSGSSLYRVKIDVAPLAASTWKEIKAQCHGRISSLLDLLSGRLSDGVMRIVTDPRRGLFPSPREIKLSCSCPDWADLCKHVAAVIYGVGARLDRQPDLLFALRGVDHHELLAADMVAAIDAATAGADAATRDRSDTSRRRKVSSIGNVFGIDLAPPATGPSPTPSAPDAAATAAAAARSVASPSAAPQGTRRTPPRAVQADRSDSPRTDPRPRTSPRHDRSQRPSAPGVSRRKPAQFPAASPKTATVPTPGPGDILTGPMLVAWREQFGLSRQELADLILLPSVSMLARWERDPGSLTVPRVQEQQLRRLMAMSPQAMRDHLRERFPLRRRPFTARRAPVGAQPKDLPAAFR